MSNPRKFQLTLSTKGGSVLALKIAESPENQLHAADTAERSGKIRGTDLLKGLAARQKAFSQPRRADKVKV